MYSSYVIVDNSISSIYLVLLMNYFFQAEECIFSWQWYWRLDLLQDKVIIQHNYVDFYLKILTVLLLCVFIVPFQQDFSCIMVVNFYRGNQRTIERKKTIGTNYRLSLYTCNKLYRVLHRPSIATSVAEICHNY